MIPGLSAKNILASRIRGTLFGQAIGDALGLGAEGMSRDTVEARYPDGLIDYDEIIRDSFRRWWKVGEWTDDTEQMLCILESLLAHRRVDIHDVARKFYRWSIDDGRGIGNTVLSVINHPSFLIDPHQAASDWWEQTGKQYAANGAVMRTSVLGIWQFNDSAHVRKNAGDVARITHADPRCAGSCAVICHVIAATLRGEIDRAKIWDELFAFAPEYHLEFTGWLRHAREGKLESMQLDHEATMGYTMKTMAAALHAWEHSDDFEQGVREIIEQGGDADTNGAVTGALLGVKLGEEAIPPRWIEGLVHRKYLHRLADEFVEVVSRQFSVSVL